MKKTAHTIKATIITAAAMIAPKVILPFFVLKNFSFSAAGAVLAAVASVASMVASFPPPSSCPPSFPAPDTGTTFSVSVFIAAPTTCSVGSLSAAVSG